MGYYNPKYQPTEQDLKATNWWNGTLSINEQKALANKHLLLPSYITCQYVGRQLYYELRVEIWKKEGSPIV